MKKILMALSFGSALLLPGFAQAAQSSAFSSSFTPEDYQQIKELTTRYVYAVDNCGNSGNDYADLYTPDGTFGVSIAWDEPGTVWAAGHDALAKAGGGGPNGCRPLRPDRATKGMHHLVTSQIILPDGPGRAIGKSTLLTIGVGGDNHNIEYQGGYQDVYVKTADGWRIKTRWHVWLDQEYSIQAKAMGRTKETGSKMK